MMHWLQLVSLVNSAPSAGEQQMWSQVRKEIADLRAQVKRSRSPRDKGKGQSRGSRALSNVQPLALPAPPSAASATPKASASKRKGRGKGKQSDGWQRPVQGATWSFQDMMRVGPATRGLFFTLETSKIVSVTLSKKTSATGTHALGSTSASDAAEHGSTIRATACRMQLPARPEPRVSMLLTILRCGQLSSCVLQS